jgi:hypothetical protein
MMKALALLLALVPVVALAQQAPPMSDEQLQQLMIRTLRAELDLANALATRREAEWGQYSKSLWQPPEPAK